MSQSCETILLSAAPLTGRGDFQSARLYVFYFLRIFRAESGKTGLGSSSLLVRRRIYFLYLLNVFSMAGFVQIPTFFRLVLGLTCIVRPGWQVVKTCM